MMDDLKHYAKYAGMWLTTRGVLTLAVIAATAGLGMGGYYAPLLTLPIGLGAAMYMHSDRTSYLKTRTKNAYKLELAATLGKDPKEVTVADLERVAKGDSAAGLPGNAILKEQLDCIDTHHRVSLFSNVTAIGLAIAAFATIMTGGFENIIQGWQNVIKPLTDALPIRSVEAFAAGTIASGITLSSDFALTQLGKYFTGLNEPTTYDYIQDIKKQRRNGHAITPEQVLEVFVRRDPDLAARIRQDFGTDYAHLPSEEKTMVLDGLKQKELLEAITRKINEGRVSPNELTFLAEAQHSGLLERQPTQQHAQLFLPGILQSLVGEKIPAQTEVRVTQTPEGKKVEERTTGRSETYEPDGSVTRSFVERYAAHTGGKDTQSFVQRISEEHSLGAAPPMER